MRTIAVQTGVDKFDKIELPHDEFAIVSQNFRKNSEEVLEDFTTTECKLFDGEYNFLGYMNAMGFFRLLLYLTGKRKKKR